LIDKLFLILILGVSFANFLFFSIDLWHGQGRFVQLGIMVFYFLHLFKKSKPLACLFLWSGLLTSFYFYKIFENTKQYPLNLFMPFFNFFVMIILFDLITKHIKKETYEKILKYLPIVLLVIFTYSILQRLNLDQFYKPFNAISYKTDFIIGTTGNAFHLGQYICILLPCIFLLKQPFNKLGILFSLFIIIMTGSASSLIIALLVILFYSIFYPIFNKKEIILSILIIFLILLWEYNSIKNIIINFTFSSGRFAIWKKYIPIFSEKPITGWGFGVINALSQKQEFLGWRHLHNEFYHYAIELGLVGLGIIIWGIVDYFKNIKIDKFSLCISCMFLAFCLCSLLGYPSHLWLLSTFGLFAYSYNYLEV